MSPCLVHRARPFFIAALLLLLPIGWAAAQILYGSLVGTVIDTSGAVVPGATVTITHKDTGQSRTATTTEAGQYNFPTIQTGRYEIRVTKEGFATFTRAEVEITINTLTRVDATLRPGAVVETVTVTADAPLLQSDTAQVRGELGSRTLENLPVPLGRNYQNLMRVLPGFRPPTNAHSVPTNPSRALTFNVNGVSQSINNTRIDGASNNNPWLPHITSFVPTLESIETVNVVTNSYDAEQGLAGGAAINVQIKSGTNELHGSVFENYTGNKLKARPFFLPQDRDKPRLVNNEFGGTVGGPILKNRLFYFASYEGTLNRETASRFGAVPTAVMKAGDFSASSGDIFDPLTGNPDGSGRTKFPGNRIPEQRISPIARKLANLTPVPNVASARGFQNNFFGTNAYLLDRHRGDGKINWRATDKLNLFGRFSVLSYNMNNPELFGAVGGPETSAAGGNPGNAFGKTYSLTFAGNYVLGPNVIIDASFGWTQFGTTVEQSRLDEKLGLDFLGIPGTNGPRRFEGGWPRFDITSFTDLGISNNFMPYTRRDPQFQYVANVNWTKGTHEIRAGFDFYQSQMNHSQPEFSGSIGPASGGFQFVREITGLRVPGGSNSPVNEFNSYAGFLLGLPSGIGRILQVPTEFTTRQWNYSWYVRDRWNATRKLTLSYGLRYEYFPIPTRANRGLEVFDGEKNRILVCGVGSVPEDCGRSESLKRFAPRVGIAYRATDTFVIRAGYGITNDPYSLQRTLRTNFPVLAVLNVRAPGSPFQPAGSLATGIPAISVPDVGNGVLEIPGTLAARGIPERIGRGYIQSWNFTLQKQLRWGFTGQAGYVGTRSVRQFGELDVNAGQVIGAGEAGRPLNQKFGRTAETIIGLPFGTTQYDSLQASLERRFSAGLQVGVGYTWSKVIGVNTNSDSGPNATAALAFWDRNRTVLGYDRTQNLQITSLWELPLGKGRRWANNGVAAAILGDWQINNLLSFYTGTPFTVTAPGNTLLLPGSTQTADLIKSKAEKLGSAGPGQFFFDKDAFARPSQGRFGNLGINALRGPGIANWDFGVSREFAVTEKYRLQFRMESFNFSNTPHFANPNGDVSSANFMQILSTTNIGRDGIDERQFRFGLRLSF